MYINTTSDKKESAQHKTSRILVHMLRTSTFFCITDYFRPFGLLTPKDFVFPIFWLWAAYLMKAITDTRRAH